MTGESIIFNTLDTILTKEEEQELVKYCTNRKVQFYLDKYKDNDKDLGYYIKGHWAKVTAETLVKMGDLVDPIIVVIDHRSEINIMSKEITKHGKWAIDIDHGWVIRAANNIPGDLYSACSNNKVQL